MAPPDFAMDDVASQLFGFRKAVPGIKPLAGPDRADAAPDRPNAKEVRLHPDTIPAVAVSRRVDASCLRGEYVGEKQTPIHRHRRSEY